MEQGLASQTIDVSNRAKLQLFEDYAQVATYVNSIRSIDMQERIQERSQTVNEISALMNGGQVSVPKGDAFKAGTIAQTPVAESVYRSAAMDMQKWQMEVQSQQQMMGGMMGLFGNLISLPFMGSSPSFKTGIREPETMLEKVRGLDIKAWRYKPEFAMMFGEDDGERIGPMADQWASIFGGDGVTIDKRQAVSVIEQAARDAGVSVVDVFGTALLILQQKAKH
jgi:hypothetical protein